MYVPFLIFAICANQRTIEAALLDSKAITDSVMSTAVPVGKRRSIWHGSSQYGNSCASDTLKILTFSNLKSVASPSRPTKPAHCG